MNNEEALIEHYDHHNEAACRSILSQMGDKQVEYLYDATRPVKSARHRLYEIVRKEMIRRGKLIAIA